MYMDELQSYPLMPNAPPPPKKKSQEDQSLRMLSMSVWDPAASFFGFQLKGMLFGSLRPAEEPFCVSDLPLTSKTRGRSVGRHAAIRYMPGSTSDHIAPFALK
jgi:hypothetical protein